ILGEMGYDGEAKSARHSAELAARTITSKFDRKLGYIPAVFEAGNASATIPAIEGLLFPHRLGLLNGLKKREPHKKLFETLRLHFRNILKPGICLFKDNGWKMSSTSTNSWQSKIFLCQHIARAVLGVKFGADEAKHDRAHADWWRVGSAPWAVIDQIWEGKTTGGGCIYPRGVTNILWLEE
ncbi:MAG TPA: beta-xylosidase, partial [Planctomycetota bacterium]|nr:beta-xylosidase [Planctomycetota bacterium]